MIRAIFIFVWLFYQGCLIEPTLVFEAHAEISGFTPEMLKFCEDQKMKDPANYRAMSFLHLSMDDDSSGTIDVAESLEFAREELHITERDRLDKRKKAFHQNNDEFITLDDLWCKWVHSEEHNWSTNDIVNWLQYGVELPQYKATFEYHRVSGLMMPRISSQNSSYLTTILGILNPIHRHKIQLKAMDVVLFGYKPYKSNLLKDAILLSLLFIAVAGYYFAVTQKQAAREEAHRLASQMDKLKDIEHEFVTLQEKFHEERIRNENMDRKSDSFDAEKEEQIESLKNQLIHAERFLEKRNPQLISLLRKTYDLEISRINGQKAQCLKEMADARQMVDKYQKKQNTFLNQIRSIHGVEMESIEQRILHVKEKLEETAYAMEECQERWNQIEELCGGHIMPTSSSQPNHIAAASNAGVCAGWQGQRSASRSSLCSSSVATPSSLR